MDQVVLTFAVGPRIFSLNGMSENHRFYLQKMAQRRQSRQADRPLRAHLEEILGVVRECEARWALEDRIDRRLGLG